MLETNENKRQAIAEATVNETMTAELRVFSFISTTRNKMLTDMGAFKDEKLLETELNKELDAFKALPADTKKIKIAEF